MNTRSKATKRRPKRSGSGKKPSPKQKLFPVVGVGASAGGFEAFKQLLQALAPDTGMAYILVQHLDPTHDSKLTDLLSRVTQMPVIEARNRMPIEPDHVYVLAPNTSVEISNGALKVTRRQPVVKNLPVDTFFQSLAENRGRMAIGVVLSGTAHDGSEGVCAIKMAGGITFAESLESAKYPGMPESAVATGCVDFVLSPTAIARELTKLGPDIHEAATAAAPSLNEQALLPCFELLWMRCGVNFAHYKQATVHRRIQRRMAVHHIKEYPEYLALIKEKPEELDALFSDLLIHVTGFFRDADVFAALQKKVYPALINGRSEGDPIRVWVPGCSTGEEAYSIAIGLLTCLGTNPKHIPIQLFATDISRPMLDRARTGLYPESISSDVSAAQLRRFFVREAAGYRVSAAVRECCVFAPHDLIKDTPFSNLDLVSCRNLLIYLGPVLQRRILPVFHYALKPDGFLMLGKSESIEVYSKLFKPVDRKLKLYTAISTRTRAAFPFPSVRESSSPPLAEAQPAPVPQAEVDVRREADRLLVSRFAPASVLVDENMDVLQFRGRTASFIEHAPGAASLNLLRMVPDEVGMELRAAVRKSERKGTIVRRAVSNGAIAENLEIIPLRTGPGRARHYLVIFEGTGVAPPPPEPKKPARTDTAARLRRELQSTRDAHGAIVEELEGVNEELKAYNEEVQSSNEELQTSNEELETAKEELQSANEELNTVNEELQTRSGELSRTNDDLVNLLAGVNLPILLLDEDLRVRRLTPLAEKVLGLRPEDIGRSIAHLRLPLDVQDLEGIVIKVMSDLVVDERDVQVSNGHWYAMQIRPYRTADQRISGVLLVMWDIQSEIDARLEVAAARDFSQSVVTTTPVPLLVLDSRLRVQMVNDAYHRLFNTAKEDITKQFLVKAGVHPWNLPAVRNLLKSALAAGKPIENHRLEYDFPGIGNRILDLTARLMAADAQGAPRLLLALEDMTESERLRLQAVEEAEIRGKEARLRALYNTVSESIITLDDRGIIESVNAATERMFGYAPGELDGSHVRGLMYAPSPDARDIVTSLEKSSSQAGQGRSVLVQRKDGTVFPVELIVNEWRLANSPRRMFISVMRDITERRQIEAAVVNASEEERQLIGSELHDEIGQSLPAIGYIIGAIQGELTKKGAPEAAELAKVAALVQASAERMHELSRGLFPSELKRTGLAGALEELVSNVHEVFGITCRYKGPKTLQLGDHHVVRQLYRIAQEAVYNAARKSGAKEIVIRLAWRKELLVLTIQDDGSGIPPLPAANPGLGLRIMRFRSNLIGAILNIDSKQGKGTTVTCMLHVSTQEEEHA